MSKVVELKINHYGKEIEVGKITWDVGPGNAYTPEILPQQYTSDEDVLLVGLNYIDFSDFLFLIEVVDADYGATQYFFDVQDVKLKDKDVIYLEEWQGGYQVYTERVLQRLKALNTQSWKDVEKTIKERLL